MIGRRCTMTMSSRTSRRVSWRRRFDEQGSGLRSREGAQHGAEGAGRAVPVDGVRRRSQPHELGRARAGRAGEAAPREAEEPVGRRGAHPRRRSSSAARSAEPEQVRSRVGPPRRRRRLRAPVGESPRRRAPLVPRTKLPRAPAPPSLRRPREAPQSRAVAAPRRASRALARRRAPELAAVPRRRRRRARRAPSRVRRTDDVGAPRDVRSSRSRARLALRRVAAAAGARRRAPHAPVPVAPPAPRPSRASPSDAAPRRVRRAPPRTGIETWAGRPGVPMPHARAPRAAGAPVPRRVQYDPRASASTGAAPRRDMRSGGSMPGRPMGRPGGAGMRRGAGGAARDASARRGRLHAGDVGAQEGHQDRGEHLAADARRAHEPQGDRGPDEAPLARA